MATPTGDMVAALLSGVGLLVLTLGCLIAALLSAHETVVHVVVNGVSGASPTPSQQLLRPPPHPSASPPPPAGTPPAITRSRTDGLHSGKLRSSQLTLDGTPGPAVDRCHGHGVYHPVLHECRCTAGWGGRFCEERQARPCNYNTNGGSTNVDSLCAGNCDEDRGHCYCAGLSHKFQRSLPHYCAPWAHRLTKLPDGRPAYPVRRRDGSWAMANLIYERPTKERPWLGDWARYYLKPYDAVYGPGSDFPPIPNRRGWPKMDAKRVGWCEANASTSDRRLMLKCDACYEGRTGPLCEQPKRSYCLRDCMGRGSCDSGFCWCQRGWHGVDCGESTALVRNGAVVPNRDVERLPAQSGTGTAEPSHGDAPLAMVRASPMQLQQQLPSRANGSPLRVYVYDMPAEFTTRMLQYRPTASVGVHRFIDGNNRSRFHPGSLYAMESALHEWLLDSPLRTTDPKKAHLFYVPVYAASLFMWPISKFADEPYYGRKQHENRRRSHQGTLFLKRALNYIRQYHPYWDASRGADHIWLMLHDEGPCFAPRELRSSILLTHYGYWSAHPRPWGTYYDDNFMQDPNFYRRHLGEPSHPTPCFTRGKDLCIPPWKTPSFWQGAFKRVRPRTELARKRSGLVFFAGDLGLNRLPGYSHDLRQRAYSMFCDPRTTHKRDCTPYVYGCRKEFPMNCSRWEPGVTIKLHSARYHEELMGHTFCLAFPGDGWSSRVLDAVVHGCIPVVVQDESEMFFEGAFAAAGLPVDYNEFSIRLLESELPSLVSVLKAVSEAKARRMRRMVLWLRDYFVYKDMYNPSAKDRADLLSAGRPAQDAFLLLALALEARARALGKLTEPASVWRTRNTKLLGAAGQGAGRVLARAANGEPTTPAARGHGHRQF